MNAKTVSWPKTNETFRRIVLHLKRVEMVVRAAVDVEAFVGAKFNAPNLKLTLSETHMHTSASANSERTFQELVSSSSSSHALTYSGRTMHSCDTIRI